MPEARPTFASRHPYEAVVNGISYGYFSNAAAAAKARFWAAKLAREQGGQNNLPLPETQQEVGGVVIDLAGDKVIWRSGRSLDGRFRE